MAASKTTLNRILGFFLLLAPSLGVLLAASCAEEALNTATLEAEACPGFPDAEPCETCATCPAGVEPIPQPQPAGFPPEDEFPLDPKAALEAALEREVPKELHKPIRNMCRHRVKNSSRVWQLGKQIVSRIDGSAIHDRDRPSGLYFYAIAVKMDLMDPESCVYHRVPKLKEGHPTACYQMAAEYSSRFTVELAKERKDKWLHNSHAYEYFGARGPIDWNAYHGYGTIPGCYDFASFDRTDVAMTACVRKSHRICIKHGCANYNSKRDIKPHWNKKL